MLDNLDMLLGGSAPVAAQSKPENDPLDADVHASGGGDSNTRSSDSPTLARAKERLSGIDRTRKFVPRSTRTRHQAVDRMLSTLLVEIDGVYSGQAPEAFKDTLGTQFKVRLCLIQCGLFRGRVLV
jgi:hypothetical protein